MTNYNYKQDIIDTFTYYLVIQCRNGTRLSIGQDTDYDKAKALLDSFIQYKEESGLIDVTYHLVKISPEIIV